MKWCAIVVSGVCAFSTVSHAQDCSGDPGIVLTASDGSPTIGKSFSLTSQTIVGDVVILLISFGGNPVETPYGSLCVSLPAAIVSYSQVSSSVVLPTTIPFDMNYVDVTPHFQFFSQSPFGGAVHRSNALAVTIDDGSGLPYPVATIKTKVGPGEPALSDLDGDGKLDLAVPYQSTIAAEITYGDGNGGFGAWTAFSDTADHNTAAVGDVDGDSDPDLLLLRANSLQVWRNLGAGQFALAGEVSTGLFTARLTTGDFDLDGDLDVATADSAFSNVIVLTGEGAGTYATHLTFPAGPNPRGIAATDLNNDGDLDLAVTRGGLTPGVGLHFGGGAAAFSLLATVPTGASPGPVVAADVDADGRSDLVVASTDTDTIAVLRNKTSFFATTTLNSGDQPNGLAVVDFDGDGILDIAVANSGSTSIGLYQGLGSGSYSTMVPYGTSGAPFHLAAGDLDQNGRPDLVATVSSANAVALHLDRDTGGFGLQGVPDLNSPVGVRAAVLGDFDSDSNTDIVGIDATNSKLLRYFGDGFGTFTTATNVNIPLSPLNIVAADLDHDSDLDVLTSTVGGTMGVLLGNGTGAFTSSTTSGLRNGILALGDLDNDGTPDFIATGLPVGGLTYQLQGFRGAGNGTFSAWPSVPTTADPTEVLLGDIDLDGDLDCLTCATGANGLQRYTGNGTGGFTNAGLVPIGGQTWSAALGDLDADGDLDAMVGLSSITPCYGDGLGSFVVGTPISIPAGVSDIALADLDGDLRLDIATVSNAKATVWTGFAAAGGGYPTQYEFRGVAIPSRLLIGTIDHDSLPDLVSVSSQSTSSIAILLHR